MNTDRERLDWLESLMRPANTYVEVYLAGLRRSIDHEATSFQVELQDRPSVNGTTLREAIDVAMKANGANSHVWCDGPLVQCIKCGEWKSEGTNLPLCDPTKLVGKTEYCCDCGEDYPRSDLIAGEIYCAKCRHEKRNSI